MISIDNSQINRTSTLDDLLQMVENKDSKGSYHAVSGESLTTVFVYVPHFSAHTISITAVSQALVAASNFLAPMIFSVLFTIASVGGLILQKRKYQGEF
jgi:Flp pilus assembly protein TadG